MASSRKEIEKRMLIKKTINAMNKQIQKLEEQKRVYIEAGRLARSKGLTAQYNLALAGLRMTIAQQRRVYEMKLNFEITSQMKDMSAMTVEFLDGMSTLSKDMMKLTRERDFLRVQKQFTDAMAGVEMQTEQMESFMEETEAAFSTSTFGTESENVELESLLDNEAATGEITEEMIDRELEELKKKMGGGT